MTRYRCILCLGPAEPRDDGLWECSTHGPTRAVVDAEESELETRPYTHNEEEMGGTQATTIGDYQS